MDVMTPAFIFRPTFPCWPSLLIDATDSCLLCLEFHEALALASGMLGSYRLSVSLPLRPSFCRRNDLVAEDCRVLLSPPLDKGMIEHRSWRDHQRWLEGEGRRIHLLLLY